MHLIFKLVDNFQISMKKVLTYSILGMFFSSCQVSFWTFMKYSPEVVKELSYTSKEIKMEKKTAVTYHYGKKFPFVFGNGSVFIPCNINDTAHLVFYNTDGSGFNINFIEQISGNVKFPKTCKTVKERTGIKGVTVKKGLNYYNITSDFFDFKQYVGRLQSISNDSLISKCMLENDKNRFHLGTDAFPKWSDVMFLNFSDTSIMLLDSLGQYDTTGFIAFQSDFRCIGLVVRLAVDSVEYNFFLHTNNKDFLTIPQYKQICLKNGKCEYLYSNPPYEKHKKESDISINHIKRDDFNNLVIDTFIVQQTNTIKLGNLDSMKCNIYYQKIDRPIMGMAFISQFDWIIDCYRGKMYAKKIKETSCESFQNYYQVNAFDSNLQISCLPVGEMEYQLFSIIDSVNGEKVSADNICQMRELLNKKDGFKENQIVVLPPPFDANFKR